MAKNNTVRLRATQGADEANYAGVAHRVDNSGHITVDMAAVAPLIEKGGFVIDDPEVQQPVAVPEGFIRMEHEWDGSATCSCRGQSYTVDDDGFVNVPVEAVADLIPHGFRVARALPPSAVQSVVPMQQAAAAPGVAEEPAAPQDTAAPADGAGSAGEDAAKGA
jgi:hypothetical protein